MRGRHGGGHRKVNLYGAKFWHVANVATPDEIDEALRDLLTEAYNGAKPT